MKKRITCFIIALVMAALPLASCGDGTGNAASDAETGGGNPIHGSAPENIGEFAQGGGYWLPYIWGDFIFIVGAVQMDYGMMDRILFRDITDPESEWMELLDYDFNRHDIPDGFEAIVGDMEFVIDDEATAENGGAPVFVIAYTLDLYEKNNSHNNLAETRVVSFNMKTQKLTTIKSGINGSLAGTVYMYHGVVYFGTTMRDSEQGKNIVTKHIITVDSGEYKAITIADDMKFPYLQYIAGDAIYYSDLEKVYSSALDFSGLSYLFDAYEVCYVDSEYIYYLTVCQTETYVTTSFSLCRKKINDISAPGEVVFSSEDLTEGPAAGYGCYCYGSDFYVRTETEGGDSVICLYDIKTGEYRKLIEYEDDIYPKSYSSDYLLAQDSGKPYICIDKKTGEITRVERWRNPWE